MSIEVRGLTKTFGTYKAADNVSFHVPTGRLAGLLGPSGGGKTTLLRMIAGLEFPDSGDILLDGRNVNGSSPRDRGIGFVFQSYALFRSMTVFENIAFGLKVRKKSKRDIERRVAEMIELTGLGGLERRLPHQLSGGQKQRVAFARALAPEPRLLLLDEPFAAIDAKVRKELRIWLKDMIRKVGVTTLFVTHDQEEAMEVADEMIVIHQGKVEQQGTPEEIYRKPASPFVARFFGETSVIRHPERIKGFERLTPGSQAFVRPDFVEVLEEGAQVPQREYEVATVLRVGFRGKHWQIDLELAGDTVTTDIDAGRTPPQPGDPIRVIVHKMYVFENGGGSVVERDVPSGKRRQLVQAFPN